MTKYAVIIQSALFRVSVFCAFVFCVFVFCADAAAQTPPPCADAPRWDELADPQRREAVSRAFGRRGVGDECFSAMLSALYSADRKLASDSLDAVFSSRAAKGRFPLELLFSLFRAGRLARDKNLWGRIVDVWSASSVQPAYAVLAANSEGGKLPTADTLYGALDAAGRLDAHELLRFGRVKCLLGDYRAAARVYCRAVADDRRLEHAAFTQMGQLFADADSAVQAAALGDFERCALALPSSDTAFFRDKLADLYGRGGHYGKEIAILAAFDSPSSPSGRRLADAARGHFAKRRYRYAASAAAAAYPRLDDKDQRTGIASVAYQSYMQLGARDSALVWLSRAESAGKDARVQAAALNQETGHLNEAAALIDSLPASLSKDTLLVRQRLFSGDPGKALNLVITSKSASWVMSPRDRMLWRVRCMAFGGQVYEAAPALDSIRFMASWHGAAEILRYKYWIQKLEDDQSALETWGRLEYLIYVGDLNAASAYLRKAALSGESGQMLAVRLARALSAASRFQEALETLELVDGGAAGGVGGGVDYGINLNRGGDAGKVGKNGNNVKGGKDARTPEYLYLKAEMLKESGRPDDARAMANRILSDYPADIFAQKARILLSRI